MAARLGLAIGTDRLVAVRPAGRTRGHESARVAECRMEPAANGEWPALEGALDELGFSWKGSRIGIALLPPLARAKILRPPPVRPNELDSLVRHGIRRYFPGSSEPMIVGAVPLGGGKRVEVAFAACAPAWVAAIAAEAVRSRGARVDTVLPATAGLAAALGKRIADVSEGRVAIVTCGPRWSEAVLLENGTVRMILPLGLASTDHAHSRLHRVLDGWAAGERPDRIILCGTEAGVHAARAALRDAGARCPISTLSKADEMPGPEALAAAGTLSGGAGGPELVPPAVQRSRARWARRRGGWLSAAALILAVAAGGAHVRGLKSELAAVADRRERVAPAVRDAITLRRGVREVAAHLEAFAKARQSSPAWTGVFAELAAVLPDSAYLTSFVVGDSALRLAGEARSVPAVLDALAASRLFGSPKLTEPLRRTAGEARRGFGLSVRLGGGLESPPVAATAAAGSTE